MSLVFITVNSDTNNVLFAGSHMPVILQKRAFTTIVDDTDNGVSDLLINVNAHMFNDIFSGKKYINAYFDGINIVGTLMNVDSNIPTEADISLFGKSYKVQIVNNQINFPVKIHPAVANQRISVGVRVEGFPYTSVELSSSTGAFIEYQVYLDSENVCNIVPSKNADLANYWQNKLVDMAWSQADLATITGLIAHTLFHYILPNTQISLTTEEQNGLTDLQNNILPSITSTLANIIPDGSNADIHYNSYRYHVQQAKQAMDSYVVDRLEIEKYTTLN